MQAYLTLIAVMIGYTALVHAAPVPEPQPDTSDQAWNDAQRKVEWANGVHQAFKDYNAIHNYDAARNPNAQRDYQEALNRQPILNGQG